MRRKAGSSEGPPTVAPTNVTISAVVVHYRTPCLLEAAVAALHRDARSSALSLEVIVVDNGAASASTAGESAPEDLEARVLRPDENLGYAAGVNFGVERATGDVLLLMNADVAVEPGCLRALLAALEGADIAGPRLFWDRGCRLMLPPQALRTRWAELDAVWAERSPVWARSFRRRWRRRARAFWRAEDVTLCYELTGACLAVTREGWRRTGRFDERFRLYFEETEWLLRARRGGVRAVLAPAARCVHAYDRSAKREPRAQSWFEESAERFRRRRYGAWFTALLARLERAPRRFEETAPLGDGPVGDAAWVEVTTLPLGVPAAGCRVAAGEAAVFEIPEDVVDGAGSDLWVRVTDGAGRDLGGWVTRTE